MPYILGVTIVAHQVDYPESPWCGRSDKGRGGKHAAHSGKTASLRSAETVTAAVTHRL